MPALRGKTVATLFFEDSTRTRLSLRDRGQAALGRHDDLHRVDARRVNKGESLRDTVETIEAMGVDAMVVRHASRGRPAQVAGWVDASVVNAGDGWHEHPTQALLDCYTIRERSRVGGTGGFEGLRIAIVGDIKHCRVARSDVARASRARRRGHARRAARRCCRRRSRAGRSRSPRPRRRARRASTSSTCCGCSASG